MGAWHPGEIDAQARTGMAERMADVGPRVLRDHMPEQHRAFFPLLPFLVVGHVDAGGQPWATVLANPPGFVHSPDPTHLAVHARPLPGDTFAPRAGQRLGLLGLQTHTRRRNRMNGTVATADADGFTVHVDQSFGNCPKYITPRETFWQPVTGPVRTVRSAQLDARGAEIIARADTLFIATAHPDAALSPLAEDGVDVSHRGGPAGFVTRGADGALRLPDYAGNFFFNTFGNLALEPRAGLVFLDVASGDVLQLAVRGEVVWEEERHVRFDVLDMVRIEQALPLGWRATERA